MKTRAFYWTQPGWLVLPGLLYLFSQPVLAGPEVFRAGPPVEIQQVQPPAEIQRVKPPTEVQKVKPPEEIRRVAPPQEIQRVAPPQGVQRVVPSKDLRQVAPPPAMQVRTPPVPPQLLVRGIGLSNPEPRVGERVAINATLRNDTLQDLKGVRVQFFSGNQPIDNEKFVDVPAGKAVSVSAAFTPAAAGAQSVRVQVSGAGVAQVGGSQDRPLTVMARPAGEGTPEAAAVPPQRLALEKPQAYAPAPDVSRQPRPDYGKKDRGDKGKGEPGKESPEGGIPLPEGVPEIIPKGALKGQTKTGKGPHGEAIGWWDGILGVEGNGKGIPAPPAGAEELDKLLADAKKGPKPGSEAGGLYGPTRPGIGPGKWAEGGGKPQPMKEDKGKGSGGQKDKGKDKGKGSGSGQSTEIPLDKDTHTPGDIVEVVAMWDRDGNLVGMAVGYRDNTHIILWGPKYAGGGSYSPEGGGEKPSPRTPDPNMVLVLMKAPPRKHTDPRIGKVGDPPALAGKAAGEGKGAAVAAGAATAEAKWHFSGIKPGAFLKGPRDPNLPGGKWGGGTGEGFRPDLRIFILPDPPEAQAISAALSKTRAAGAPSVTVSAVAGAVQLLATREGKQGWTPLTVGSKLAANSVIRVDKGTGGEVGIGDPRAALSMRWSQIHSGPNHVLYQLKTMK